MFTLASAFQPSSLWLLEVLVTVALYATLASSLNLVTGYGGMFSLGHHGFFAVGAYAAGWATAFVSSKAGGIDVGSVSGWALFVGTALFAVAVTAVAALAVGLPCLRLRGDYLAIATLAFGEIVRIAIENTPALGGSLTLTVPRLVMEPHGLPEERLREVEEMRWLFLGVGVAMLAITVVVIRNLVRSAHGRAIVSVREDEIASELLGVPTTAYKARAFVLGGGFAGLAGWFYAHYNGSISPASFDLLVGIKILLIVVLGGLGSLWGSLVAAVVLVGMEKLLLAGYFGDSARKAMPVYYALFLILVMLGRPAAVRAFRWLGRTLDERVRAILRPSRKSEPPATGAGSAS